MMGSQCYIERGVLRPRSYLGPGVEAYPDKFQKFFRRRLQGGPNGPQNVFLAKICICSVGRNPCVSALLQSSRALRIFFPAFWIWLERIFVSQDLGVSPKAGNEESGSLFFENTTFSAQQQQQYGCLMIPKLSRIGSRIKITGRYSGNQEIYPPLTISSPVWRIFGPFWAKKSKKWPKKSKRIA